MGCITQVVLLTVASCLSLCHAYRILVVFPFPGKSHGILGDGVVRHLVAAKHEVTHVTAFPWKSTPPNLRQVDISAVKEAFPHILDLKALMDKKVDLNDQQFIATMITNIVNNVMEQENLINLLDDQTLKFDAVIAEWMFSEIYCGMGSLLEAPMIWFFPFEHPSVILSLIDETPNPAYTSSIYMSDVLPYNFVQRVKSLFTHSIIYYYGFIRYSSDSEAVYKKAYAARFEKRGRTLPPYEEVKFNISLALVNSHTSLGTSLRLPQNYINIGGYHVDNDVKPLPEDLKKVMDSSANGVIYFSMGSSLQSKELPDEIKKGLVKMFGGLKQTVIWKFEERLSNLPKNLHIVQWAPQTSILNHPKCVLFITHGGLLSITETVHFGKPIIGIPVFADQFLNVDKAVAKGIAKRVDLTYDVVSDLKAAIDDILTDSRYANSAKELSLIYHDRVAGPGAELVHWVEHVVRTRGAPHLRSPALAVPLYQKLYLDLAALLIVLLLLARVAIKRLLCSNKSKQFDSQSTRKKKKN